MATVTLTPTACTSTPGQWVVLYNYLTTNSSYYPRQLIFTFPANSDLSSEGVNITSVTIHGYVRNSASALKQLRIGFRTSASAGVAEWASIDGADVLEGAFIAIDGWDTSGYGYATISRTYSGSGMFAKWIKQQFQAGQPLYMGVIQPQSGKSISVNTTLASWTIDIEYELLGNIPTTDKSTVKLTESITTTVNRIIADSTTTLKYKIGDSVLSTVDIGTATSHTYTVPRSAGTKFPNDLTATLTIEAVTSLNGTTYGAITTTATITLPDDAAPTVSLYRQTRLWKAGVSTSSVIGAYVQNQCGYQAKLTIGYKYGSSIVSQKAVCEGNEVTYADNWFYYCPFTTSGEVATTFTVTDSRGLTGSLTITNTVLPWSAPTIQAFKVDRATDAAVTAIDGTCAMVEAAASASSLITDGIAVSAKWSVQQSGSGTASFANIRSIRALNNLTVTRQDGETFQTVFPESVCAGTFDTQGNGKKMFDLLTLNGAESWNTWGVSAHKSGLTGFYMYLSSKSLVAASETSVICSHLPYVETWGGYAFGVFVGDSTTANPYLILSLTNDLLSDTSSNDAAIASLKSLLAAQKAAGTPVQVALQLSTEQSFTATPLMVSKASETDTFTSNADTITLTGNSSAEQNALTFTVQYREIGATDWTNADTIATSSISTSISGLLASSGTTIDSFNDMAGYEFRLCASDLYTTSYASDQMPTKEQYWDIDESTGKMGFGGDAPTSDEDAGFRFFKQADFKSGYKVYSTSEVDTGNKWIDGKTIYRACVRTTTTIVNGIGDVATLPSNIETPVSFRAFAKLPADSGWRPVPNAYHANTSYTVLVYFKNNKVSMGFGSAWSGTKEIIIIVEYTK